MKKTFRKVQFLANIATIVIAVLLSFVVVKQYFFTSDPLNRSWQRAGSSPSLPVPTRPVPESPVGKTIPLENVNWKENKRTLVLYASTNCKYCTESSPFYQRLVKEMPTNGVSLVAVLPQSVEEAKAYLNANDVNIPQVLNSSLDSIGVRGTPTLLLIDENGVISEYWRGKLSPDKEAEVLGKLSS